MFPHVATDIAFVMFTKQRTCVHVCGRGYTLSLCVNVERRLGLLNLGKECRLVCVYKYNTIQYNNIVVSTHISGELVTIRVLTTTSAKRRFFLKHQ